MEQNIIVKGTPQKNKSASIVITVGVVLLVASIMVASHVFYNNLYVITYVSRTRYYWVSRYNSNFGVYFIREFFNPACIYGYMIFLGIAAIVIGNIIKANTEKCEITVTDEAVSGKLPHGKPVNIPLNQITAINRSSFNGLSITSIGNSSNFHCIENREEIIKAVSYFLANPRPVGPQSAQYAASGAERLNRLKSLLDSGALTQEEFDAKKKQILGL